MVPLPLDKEHHLSILSHPSQKETLVPIMYLHSLFLPFILLCPTCVRAVCHYAGDRSCEVKCERVPTCQIKPENKPTCPPGQHLEEINLSKQGCAYQGDCLYFYIVAKCFYKYNCVRSSLF